MSEQTSNKMNNKDIIKWGLFFGSIWGFFEATLGFILHLVHGPSGTILFPIALIIMTYAYDKTKNLKVIGFSSVVAALIKLTNIFLLFALIPDYTTLMIVKIINPAVSLLVEGAFFALAIRLTLMEGKKLKPYHIIGAVYGYETVYRVYQYTLFKLGVPMGGFKNGFDFVNAVLVSGISTIIVSMIAIIIYNQIISKNKTIMSDFEIRFNYSAIACGISVLASSIFYLV